MPEALTAIPSLKLKIESNLSETDSIGTDRSTTSTNASSIGVSFNRSAQAGVAVHNDPISAISTDAVTKRKHQQPGANGQSKKSRRSIGRRGPKKSPLKMGNSPQKNAAALCIKSQIPRALLLTPSSSSTSLNTNASSSSASASLEGASKIYPASASAVVNVVARKVAEVEAKAEAEAKVEAKVPAGAAAAETKVETVSKTEIRAEVETPAKIVATPSSKSHATVNTALAPLTSRSVPGPLQLQRQHTAAILNFRIRKSISQMELKRTHRGSNFVPLPLSSSQSSALAGVTGDSKALVPNTSADIAGIIGCSSQSSLVNKIFDQNSYYYVIQDRDPKVAGMRIFATIMLNAWRKRRDEVKRLMEEVNDLKRGSIKAKNQLHVFNTLFRVEQKRNDELSCQLKRSLEDINNTKSSCESLTTSLISLKADKALLEQQIQIKEQEFDGLNAILTQTKSDLFKAMAQQRELQASLSSEQRKVQSLESQKNELINEICEVNNESLQKEENLRAKMLESNEALQQALRKIDELEQQISNLKQKTCILDSCLDNETRLKKEVDSLHIELNTLQQCLAATLGNRLKACWNSSIAYQRTTLHLLHWIAFCTLPATPPPKISNFPFGLTLEKALSIVKR